MTFQSDCLARRMYTTQVYNTKTMAKVIHKKINHERTRHGLPPLSWDDRITGIALEKCLQMAKSKITDHEGFKDRIQSIARSIRGVKYCGENVGSNVAQLNPSNAMVKGWIDSQGHYENLMGDFHLTAVAAHQATDGKYYFTQIFVKV